MNDGFYIGLVIGVSVCVVLFLYNKNSNNKNGFYEGMVPSCYTLGPNTCARVKHVTQRGTNGYRINCVDDPTKTNAWDSGGVFECLHGNTSCLGDYDKSPETLYPTMDKAINAYCDTFKIKK